MVLECLLKVFRGRNPDNERLEEKYGMSFEEFCQTIERLELRKLPVHRWSEVLSDWKRWAELNSTEVRLPKRRDVVRRLKVVDGEISKIEDKYGLSYRHFYDLVEGEISYLLERFELGEILEDFGELLDLLAEKEMLMEMIGKRIDLIAKLDEGWVRICG